MLEPLVDVATASLILASFLVACTCRYRQLFPSRQAPFLKYLEKELLYEKHEISAFSHWRNIRSFEFEIIEKFVTTWMYMRPCKYLYYCIRLDRTRCLTRCLRLIPLSLSIYVNPDHVWETRLPRVTTSKFATRNIHYVPYRQATLCVQLSAIFLLLLRCNDDRRRVVPRMMSRARVCQVVDWSALRSRPLRLKRSLRRTPGEARYGLQHVLCATRRRSPRAAQ